MSNTERPNILFILADDLGWADLSCHGSPIRTPNIDRLMSDGVELTQHYVCPMCTPTRASLLTGRHPGRFGDHATVPSNAPVLPDGYATLATVLRGAGYDTGLFGKWHLGSRAEWGPNRFGFNTSYGSLAGGVDPFNHRYKRGEYSFTWHRNGELIEHGGHVTDLICREAVAWMESREAPWFCYAPFTAVHVPIKPTHEWFDRYHFDHYDDDPAKDLSYKKYAAYTTHMDWAVGEMLDVLERTGQRDNTMVVFTSDNGAINDCPIHSTDQYPGWQEAYPRLGSNLPFRGVKAQLYEGGIRMPTVVNWRGRLDAGEVGAAVHAVDWMPTLCALAGAEPATDPQWDGVDIWPLIAGQSDRRAIDHLFWNFRGGKMLGARVGEWKLVVDAREDSPKKELFNIEEDPYEERELSAQHEPKVTELMDYIQEQRKLDDASKRPDVE